MKGVQKLSKQIIEGFTWQVLFSFCYFDKEYKPDTTCGFAFIQEFILN